MQKNSARLLSAAVAAVLLAACGGGNSANPSANPALSGRTAVVTGAISGFGSVIVNGVHYESDAASVTREGRAATVGDLKVGDIVTIRAEYDKDGVPRASAIEQDRLVQGPVEAVDVDAGTLTVAGQLIRVDAETIFDDSIPGASLAGIQVGDRVEVNGFVSSTGEATATRIELADANDDEIEITGPVDSIDTSAMTLVIGTQTVDYSDASLEGFGEAGPAVGDLVEVKGDSIDANGVLIATKVEKEDHGRDCEPGDESELEGLVTRFVSATDFDVNGHPVTTDAGTQFKGGTAADLALDIRIEVEGEVDANGIVVADEIEIKKRSTLKIEAAVDAVDATAGTVTVLGLTFTVNDHTRREDDKGGERFFDLADVNVGDWVEIAGYPDGANAGAYVATKLERDDADDEVEIEGRAGTLAEPDFEIAGVTISTTDETVFRLGQNEITAADFFAAADGKRVEVEGTWNGTEPLIATKVQLSRADDNSGED